MANRARRLRDGLRNAGPGTRIVVGQSGGGCRCGRIELDRFHFLHIDHDATAPAARAAADQNSELLILKSDHLSPQHASILQTNRVGQNRHGGEQRNQQ